MKKDFIKVTMNLHQRSIDNVELLSSIMKEKNRTRVVSSSLEISKNLLTRVKAGDKIIVESPDGTRQELTFVF